MQGRAAATRVAARWPGRERRGPALVRRLLVALACLPLAACASPRPPPEPAPQRDASPFVYAEPDVDVPARPLEPIRPDYPLRLRERGIEGRVEARVLVWPDGSVHGATLVRSDHPEFTAAAREAIAVARFAPGLKAGQPVASSVTLVLHFRLER